MLTNITRRATGLLFVLMLALSTTTRPSAASSAFEIETDVNATLNKFYLNVVGSRDLVARAAGVLVFPSVVKAGFWIGGEYGEGALRIAGKTAGYYNTVSGSIGFEFGAQARTVIILFMTPEALDSFRRRDGWKVGVDGSVALITIGVGGSFDSNQIQQPVIAFILDNKGLMVNLSLEGSKISPIRR